MENFIKEEHFISSVMEKDSDLVREVEHFLKENRIDNYRIKYDRGIDFTEGWLLPPLFEVETENLGALKDLSDKLNIPIKNDYYTLRQGFFVKDDKYQMHIYKKIPFDNPLAMR